MDSPHPLNKATVLMLGRHTQLHARIDIAKEIARLRHRQCKARHRNQRRLDRINCILVSGMHEIRNSASFALQQHLWHCQTLLSMALQVNRDKIAQKFLLG